MEKYYEHDGKYYKVTKTGVNSELDEHIEVTKYEYEDHKEMEARRFNESLK